MPKKTQVTPKWLSKKPDGSKKRLITSEVTSFIKQCAEGGIKLDSSTKLIPGFITHLTKGNAEFGKIKSHMQVTTHPFIEYLRGQLRHAITRVQRELDDAKATKDQAADDAVSIPESQAAAEQKANDDESDQESAEAEGAESDKSSSEIPESSQDAAKSSQADKISSKSKRIVKKDTDNYWKQFGNRHPEKWQELHYLRETIKGREWELRLLNMQLKKKAAEFMAVDGTSSPKTLRNTKDILGEEI